MITIIIYYYNNPDCGFHLYTTHIRTHTSIFDIFLGTGSPKWTVKFRIARLYYCRHTCISYILYNEVTSAVCILCNTVESKVQKIASRLFKFHNRFFVHLIQTGRRTFRIERCTAGVSNSWSAGHTRLVIGFDWPLCKFQNHRLLILYIIRKKLLEI